MDGQLVKIEPRRINLEEVPTVSARELHKFLGIGKDFSSWAKEQTERAVLSCGVDYKIVKSYSPVGGRPTLEYYLTLDAAKIITAMSNTPKGKDALKYFMSQCTITNEELLDLLFDIDIPDLPDMFVYIVTERETGKRKIGISKQPYERTKQLQTGNPNRLEITAVFPAPNRYEDKARLQAELSEKHLRGDWYAAEVRQAASY